jgi:hypothetical protein
MTMLLCMSTFLVQEPPLRALRIEEFLVMDLGTSGVSAQITLSDGLKDWYLHSASEPVLFLF